MNGEELRLIFNAIESGKCLAFMGAGACTTFTGPDGREVPGLPTGKQLAGILAKKCPSLDGKEYDLMTAAEHFLYEYSGDPTEMHRILKTEIQVPCGPRPIHTALAQLNPVQFIITTNYDTLMEDELKKKKYRRDVILHVHDKENPRSGRFDECDLSLEKNQVVLHKMHGTVEKPGSLVITRADYIYYLATLTDPDRGMPAYIRTWTLPRCTLLFLGYSLEDWDFQAIWEGVLSGYADRHLRKGSYALVKSATPVQKKYWARRNVDILEYDLTEFAKQLAGHFNLEIPQLKIAKKPGGGAPCS